MYKKFKKKLKEILPKQIWKILNFTKRPFNPLIFKLTLNKVQKNHKLALEKVRAKVKNGDKLKIVFLVIHEQVWKYDNIYKMMTEDPIFNPAIVICPYIRYGEEIMKHHLEKAYQFFSKKGYNVINSYSKNKWLDVKIELKPDIIFFTNPHKLTRDEYYIANFLDTLTCYVPYSFQVSNLIKGQYDQNFHNFLWKAFYETDIHLKIATKNSRNKGVNVEVVGYPNIDELFKDRELNNTDKWKIKDRQIKRIIWSPHHTIEGFGANLNYSNFLRMADFILCLAEKYKDKIQIAFKPHPLLKSKLFKHPDWGEDKTENYYKQWDLSPNSFFTDSDYIDLFKTSDGLINDSGSFLAEYFYTGRPQLFVAHDKGISERFNEFGKYIFERVYVAHEMKDIENFVNEVIINHQDSMKKIRMKEINDYKNKFNVTTSSQRVIESIKHIILKV